MIFEFSLSILLIGWDHLAGVGLAVLDVEPGQHVVEVLQEGPDAAQHVLQLLLAVGQPLPDDVVPLVDVQQLLLGLRQICSTV